MFKHRPKLIAFCRGYKRTFALRDFDGANHNFGDTSVQATSSNVGNVAVYGRLNVETVVSRAR